ncbi:hypothetical protein ACTHTR_10770, partial [Neisseria sp. P0018.S004]|uniref:hypothetical protein n=1 Tax=Neisseria sp. P0018.S004 TaxID=3436790 RepID=UPI003F81735F
CGGWVLWGVWLLVLFLGVGVGVLFCVGWGGCCCLGLCCFVGVFGWGCGGCGVVVGGVVWGFVGVLVWGCV